jgi:hypothetical protein
MDANIVIENCYAPLRISPWNKAGDRANTQRKSSSFIAIAIQRQQIKKYAGREEGDYHEDFFPQQI